MGTHNQDQSRQAPGSSGQKTPARDPKLNPTRDDENQIDQRTSDEGQGRDQSVSRNRSEDDPTESIASGGKSGSSDAKDRGQADRKPGGNP